MGELQDLFEPPLLCVQGGGGLRANLEGRVISAGVRRGGGGLWARHGGGQPRVTGARWG